MRVLKSIEPATGSRRRRARRRRDDQPSHERWLVSYADFITLMFALFATLYGISTVDARKLGAMVESAQEAFEPRTAKAIAEAEARKLLSARVTVSPPAVSEVGVAELQRQATSRLARDVSEGRVDIEQDRRGLVISIREAGSFAVGSANLSPDAQTLLGEIGSILTGVGNQVLVEGHTDDVPIHTARFASNWELSTTRATNVIAFLLDHASLSPRRVSAAGYAENRPKAPNTSDANRTRNRRVDLIVLNPTADAGDALAPHAAH